ncbi:MAG TPA: hypothetical protein PKK99_14395, partial [Bacteroidia bacterium]|nr:hypothetical protein [Bacteroidia bacterium]
MSTPTSIFRQYEQEAYATYETITGITLQRNTDGSFKSQGTNDVLDAYRHAYVSAVMTKDHGEFIAFVAGAAHEIRGDLFNGQKSEPRRMDDWNNSVGREIGAAASSRESIAQDVHSALQSGELITDPAIDKRQLPSAYSEYRDDNTLSNAINTFFLQFKNWTPPRRDPLAL